MNFNKQDKPLANMDLEQLILTRLKRRENLNQITAFACEMLACDWYAGNG